MNNSYRDFAALYDPLTFDVDYNIIANFIKKHLTEAGIQSGLVLDLACGTGTLTLLLKAMGYDMLGVDISEDMLSVARQKEGSENILFLNQPMEEFELYGTVDAIVCVLDSMNYLTEPEAFQRTLALCSNYLNPGGLLIFDVNSEFKFNQVLARETYTYETENIFYVWENEFDPESRLCDLFLTFFIEQENGLYERVDEVQTQRVYTEMEIKDALRNAGLTLVHRYDGYSNNEPQDESQRIVYIAKK